MTPAALAVNLTEGIVADPKEAPVMNIFQFSNDNMHQVLPLPTLYRGDLAHTTITN